MKGKTEVGAAAFRNRAARSPETNSRINDAMIQESDPAAELVISAISILGDKWLVFIVHQLLHGPKRHGEIRRAVPGVSQRMLTRTLQKMEAHSLLTRKVLREKPLTVQYELTQRGHTLKAPLSAMAEWAQASKQ